MKRNIRKIVVLLAIFILIISANKVYAKNTDVKLLESEVHKEWRKLSNKEKEKTIEPQFYSTNFNRLTATYKTSRINMLSNLKSSLGSKYNLNDDIKVEVKDQKNKERCWAFSLSSVLETTLSKTTTGTTYKKFSPVHMDYWVSNNYPTIKFNEGAYPKLGLNYYTNGEGPIEEDETLDSYIEENYSKYPDQYISNFKTNQHIEKYTIFPEIYKTYYKRNENDSPIYENGDFVYENNSLIYEDSNKKKYSEEEIIKIRNSIKKHIQECGAVTGVTYAGKQSTSTSELPFWNYYDTQNYSYFCNEANSANHQITIVGWDDNFSKDKFKTTPPGDGAYIALNSWGEENKMDKGYFYISYYDCLVESNVCGINKVSEKDYDNLYQYDELGYALPGEILNKEVYVLNSFNRKKENEYLTEVSFYLTDIYNVDIYYAKWDTTNKKISGEKSLIKSFKASEISENGYFTYYTYKLDEKIAVDDTFAIILKYYHSNSENNKIKIPIEMPFSESSTDVFANATSPGNRGFYSVDSNTWQDITTSMKNADICIKAYTTNNDYIKAESVSLNLEKSEMNEGDNIQLTATVTPKTATNKEVTWKSSDEKVAKVDENGKVTAVSAGKATITVITKDQEKTASCEITVNENKKDILVTQIELDENQKEIYIGDKFKINATITPDNATNKELTWETEDKSIATVSSDGTVTGVAKGKVTIKVTNKSSGKSAVCVFTVLDKVEDEYYREQEEKVIESSNNLELYEDDDNNEIQNNQVNEEIIEKNDTEEYIEETTTVDDTTYGAAIPQTGLKTEMKIILSFITIFGIISFIKFYRRRDIK